MDCEQCPAKVTPVVWQPLKRLAFQQICFTKLSQKISNLWCVQRSFVPNCQSWLCEMCCYAEINVSARVGWYWDTKLSGLRIAAVRKRDFALLSKKDEGARNRDVKYFSLGRPLGQVAVGGLQRIHSTPTASTEEGFFNPRSGLRVVIITIS